MYQQCWTIPYNDTTPRTPYGETWVRSFGKFEKKIIYSNFKTGINYESSDFLNGYPCYDDSAMEGYLNRPVVRKALNIPDSVPYWAANKYAPNLRF